MMHPKATWISVLISALAVTVLMSANAAVNNLESYKFRYDFSRGTSVYLPASDYADFEFVGANTAPTNGPNGASSAVTTTSSSWKAFSSATTLSNSWTVAASLSPAAVNNSVVFSVGRLNADGTRAVAICTSSDKSKLLVRLMYRSGSTITCTEKEMTGLGDVTQGFHTLVVTYTSAAQNHGTLTFYWDGVSKLTHTYTYDTKWFGVPDSPGGIQFNVLVSRGGYTTNGDKTFVYKNGIHSFYDFRFYAEQFDANDATAYAALYPADRMGSPFRPSAYVESGATNTIGDARNVATPMSYIDTEYKAKKGTEFVLDFQYLDCATVQQYIFGIYNGSASSTPTEDGTTHCFYINGSKGFAFARFSETSADWHAITANNAADRIRRIVSVENTDDSSVTGSEATILTWADRATMASASTTKKHENDAKRNTYLFAVNTKDEAKRFTKARIYSFEADESGTPVIFLAPDMENGEAGFRNIIDGTFHGDGNKDNNPERPLRFYDGVGCASDYKYEDSTLYAKLYASSDDGGAVSIADGAAASAAEGWIPRGGTLALSATPLEGMEFSKWTGDTWAIADGCAATDASIEVSTPYAVQLRATFKPAVNARLTVAADGADSVNWSSADWRNANDDGEAISAPSDKVVTIVAHKSVTLTLDASVSLSKFIVQADANCVVTFASGAGVSFYAGEVVVSNGVLKQGTASVLGTTPTVTVENGGTFDFNKLNPDAATSYVIAGAGAGNWPWAMTSTGGTPANYVKNITLMDDATIGSAANSQLKVGCSSDPGAVDKRGSLTLNGHTLTVADGMWITHRYVNQPGTGTIYYSSRGTSFNEGALNNQGGETTLILGAEGGSNEIAVNNATWIHALDWRGYKINTSAALTINSSLAVSGGDKETARLTFADGATAVLSDNLAVTTTLTANGALSLTRAAGVEDTVEVSAQNVAGTGTFTVGAGVRFNAGGVDVMGPATVGFAGGASSSLDLGSDAVITLDPILNPIWLKTAPAFASGAKVVLADSYADVTCGKLVLMTWSGAGEVTLPAFDASCVGGAPDGLTVETASDGVSRLVLRVGGYEQNAKAIRIAPIGDSITQGVTKDEQGDYPQYRSSMAAHLAAHGYKPTLCGIWKYANLDRAGAPMPDEWAWHTGVSGDAIVATDKSGGVMDNLHLYLDAIGKPDVITLLVGTNDMGRNGKSAEETYVSWTNLVWEIVRQRPTVKIVASTVLDRKDNTDGVKAKVSAFNTLLKAGVNAGDLPANLSLVDLFATVPLATAGNFFTDELHPNWQGHALMAKGFADGIMSACPYETFTPTVDDTVTNEAQSPLGASAIDELADYRRGFRHVYTIDAAETNAFPKSGIAPYTATNAVLRSGRKIAKVGYYMELVRKGTNRRRWVWVDMDASGKTLDDVALPWDANTERPRQFIAEKLHVKSNDSAVHAVAPTDDTVRGVFEGTPYNYSAGGTTAQLSGAPANLMTGGYGWNDDMSGTSGGFGCFQMHRIFTPEQKAAAGFPHDAEVLFAWNRWGSSSGSSADDIGIGTYACHAEGIASSTRMGNLDYSQTANGNGNLADTVSAKAYQVRRIEIWAKEQPKGVIIIAN